MTNTILTLHDPAAARHYYAAGLWREDTLYTLLARHAARRPAAFALRDGRRRLTWAELQTIVDAVAADLDRAGLKRGERVAVWLPNRVEAVAVLLACSRQGYVCNPSLHRNYTVAEIVELLTRTRAAALFAQPGYGADAHRADIFAAVAIAEALSAGMELVVNDPPPGTTPLDWILETGASYVMGVPTHAMDILGEMRRRGLDKLGEVKTFYMAGAPIPREVAQSFLDRGVIPQNVYGMSENSSHQYTLPSDAPETIVATCGKACRAYEIRLL